MIQTTEVSITYKGDGVQTAFPYPYPYRNSDDIVGYIINDVGYEKRITNNFKYDKVSNIYQYPLAGDPLAAPYSIKLIRETPQQQNADLPGKLPFSLIEKSLDWIIMILQEIGSRCNSLWHIRNDCKLSETNARNSASAAAESEENSADSENLAKKWAMSPVSPDGVADTDSPTGYTQSAKIWAALSKEYAGLSKFKLPIGYYNSVDEMRKSETAIVGRPCVTLGYYEPNAGGGALYIIREKTDSDSDTPLTLELNNGNIAELIYDKGVLYADAIGFKKCADLKSALANTESTNDDLYKAVAQSGCTLVFNDGYYPFSDKIIIYPAMTITGVNKTNTVLVFPNGDGITTNSDNKYVKDVKLNNFSIYAKNDCISTAAEAVDAVSHFYKNKFQDLILTSVNGNGFYNAYLSQALVYENDFENIEVSCAKGCGIVGVWNTTSMIKRVSDIGDTPILLKNCAGKITDCNLAYTNVDWFISWDNPDELKSFSLDLENCNCEDVHKGMLDINCSNVFLRGLTIKNCGFILRLQKNDDGTYKKLTEHPLTVGSYVMNLYIHNFYPDVRDGAFTDVFDTSIKFPLCTIHILEPNASRLKNANVPCNFNVQCGTNSVNVSNVSDTVSVSSYAGNGYEYDRHILNQFEIHSAFLYGTQIGKYKTITPDSTTLNTTIVDDEKVPDGVIFSGLLGQSYLSSLSFTCNSYTNTATLSLFVVINNDPTYKIMLQSNTSTNTIFTLTGNHSQIAPNGDYAIFIRIATGKTKPIFHQIY